MSELEDPNSHSSELQEPHLDHHDTLEEQHHHQLQADLDQVQVGHSHEQEYQVEHSHEQEYQVVNHDHELEHHQHQHHELHIPHQDTEAAAGLDQIQQQQHHQQEQHVHMGIDHQQQQYHHGVSPVTMTTLEGTEVAHIANMDATEQQQQQHQQHHQHQHQPVQHVQVQQQIQMDDHANTNANISMVDTNHNPVPMNVNVNVNGHGIMQQNQQQEQQQHHPAAHGQHIMHHQHSHHAQYQHPHVVVPVQPINYAHQPNYQHQLQHQVGQIHEHEHEHHHQQHHEEQHHQHYQTHMHDEQQNQHQHQQQQMAHAGPAEMHWHDYFNLLQAHSTLTGTLDIEPNTNPPLEQWILDQRVLYQEDAKGVETILTSERKLLLDALGFDWVVESDDHHDQHQHHHQHHMHDGTGNEGMLAHAHLHSHEHHPHHEMDANQQHHQHPQEQQEYAAHTQEQEDVHAAGGLAVNIGTVDEFNERLQQLQTFKDVNGHCNIPPDYKEDTMPDIAKWAIHQRQFYHEGSLTQDRVDALLTMGFDFHMTEGTDLKIPSFAERLGQLQEYKHLHGDIKVPRNAGFELQG